MKRNLTLALLCPVISVCSIVAQNQKVTGVVTSAEDGQPVIGAAVMVKGTTQGTITDMDGKFVLEVPQNGKTLLISYVGLATEEVQVKPNLTIVLKSEARGLDEVVVTAQGLTRKEKSLGYATQHSK